MAINTRNSVQSPAASGRGMSFEDFAKQAQARYALPEVPQVDPRELIQQQLEQAQVPEQVIPPQFNIPGPSNTQEVPPTFAPAELSASSSPAELASATGSRAAFNPQIGYATDAQGNVQYDEAGNPISQPITMGEQAAQQEYQLRSLPDVKAGLTELGKEFPDYIKASRDILEAKNQSMQTGSARYNETGIGETNISNDALDHWANSSGTILKSKAIKDENMLLNRDTAHVRTDDGAYPMALKTFFDEGITDPDEMSQAVMLTGLAHSAAVSQSAMMRDDDREIPSDIKGRPIKDSDFLKNRLDSQVHFMRNAFNNAGIQMTEKGLRQLADTYQISKLASGDDIMYFDKRQQPVIVSSAASKDEARKIAYLADALTGDNKRLMASSTPVPGGTNFVQAKPLMTARSLAYGEMITEAADATKDILGRIAYQFNPRDVQYKTLELQLIMSEAVNGPNGEFLYSTHYLADRNGLSQAHYKAARTETKPKEDYNPNDPSTGPVQKQEFEAMKDRQAADTMNNKLIALKFDLLNAQRLPGLRFSAWMHSVANQRFFPASGGTDYMSSKNGVRDMMNFGAQDVTNANNLFDPKRVEYLKGVGKNILYGKKSGKEINDALLALPPADLAAIGMMINGVINYETSINGSNAKILKTGMADILQMYDVDIGARLAEAGKEYNDFLDAPDKASDNIKQLLAGMERGEALGSKNLWDDFFNLQNNMVKDQTKLTNYKLTHLSFDDGNQNGIFLQALFSGNSPQAIQLGTFNPSQEDLRTFAFSSVVSNLDESFTDGYDEQKNAWKNFFKAIIEKHGKEKVASWLLKAPLMQASYGKDASMFGSHVQDFLSDVVPDEYAEYLGQAYEGMPTGAEAPLNAAVEQTLRQILDGGFGTQMKAVGRYMSILSAIPTLPGITGDTQIFSTPGVLPKYTGQSDVLMQEQPDGEKIILKRRAVTENLYNTLDNGQVGVEETLRGYNPNATKGLQRYWNKRTQKWDYFDNPIGSAQMRLLNVMPIQSADGDLVKLTTLFVNPNKDKLPRPVSWVHDSIISTAGSSLLYRNAYNNHSIPSAIPAIAKFASNLHTAWNTAEEASLRSADKMGVVGIGDNGDFPSLGAYFDEMYNKYTEGSDYKKFWMERNNNDNVKWLRVKAKADETIAQAKKFGWKPPFSIGGDATYSGEATRADLAITADQFHELVYLAKKSLGLVKGVNENWRYPYSTWLREFPAKVNETAQILMKGAQPHGIGQMSPTGGGGRYKGDVSQDAYNRKLKAHMDQASSKEVPAITKYDTMDLGEAYATRRG